MSRHDVRNTLVAALVLAASSAGCQLDADHYGTRYRCDEGGACPADYTCTNNGFCEPLSGGSLVGEKGCGTTNVLQDDFEDAEDNSQWYSGGYGISISEVEGLLSFDIQPDTPGAYATYRSTRRYLFRSSSVAVEASFDASAPIVVEMEVEANGSNQVTFRMRDGDLQFIYRLKDSDHVVAAVPYSETDHRWWRLRESAGVVFWETSPDNDTWEIQGRVSSTPFSALAMVELEVRSDTQAAPMPVTFDNVNASSEEEAWCPAAELRDDFDDGLVGTMWGRWADNDCSVFERDGELVFEYEGAGGPGSCGYYSVSLYDLSESSVTVEVPQVTEKNIYVSLDLDMPGDNELLIQRRELESGYELYCRKVVEGQSSSACAITYDPVAHRWWRIRSEDELVHWETSPDGQTWKAEATHSSREMPLGETEIVLSVWTDATDEAGEIVFDNLNIE